MDGNIARVQPVVGSLAGVEKPGWKDQKKDQQPFSLEEEEKEKKGRDEGSNDSSPGPSEGFSSEDLPVAPPPSGEAGGRIDVVG